MLGKGAVGMAAAVGLSGCSGYPAGWTELVYVGSDRAPHEAFTWYGPIGNVYASDGTDPRVGREGPGKICEYSRIVNRPEFDEITTETGERMLFGTYKRTLFSECIEPGKDT